MTKVYEIGGPSAQSALITPIFRAYYEEDLDICDAEVLADAAEQASVMSREEVSISRGLTAVRKDPPFRSFIGMPTSKPVKEVLVTDLSIGFLRQSAS
jgi:hypothetical protein